MSSSFEKVESPVESQMSPRSPSRQYLGYGEDRPTFRWPGGAKLAINFVLNYEEGSEYSLGAGDGRQETLGEFPTVVPNSIRDLRTESVFEYGSRIGVWRLLRMFESRKVPLTLFATASALEQNIELSKHLSQSDHDICAHGWRWAETWTYSRDEEKAHMIEAIASIEASCGRRPIGWNCRNSSTVNTRELLVEIGGFVYDSDAYNDDLPYVVEVSGQDHIVIPYTVFYNDMRYVSGVGFGAPSDFAESCKRGIDFLLEEAEDGSSQLMTIGVHARYSGQAGRAHALREVLDHIDTKDGIWLAKREEIAHFWQTMTSQQ